MLSLTALTQDIFLKPIPRTTPRGYLKSRYKTFRRKVFERDGFKCVECGSTHNLTLHHIKKVAEWPIGMYIESNCVCLCRKCHCDLHNKEG